MKSIKRTRGESHKKTKVTAVVIKLENAGIKNTYVSWKKRNHTKQQQLPPPLPPYLHQTFLHQLMML